MLPYQLTCRNIFRLSMALGLKPQMSTSRVFYPSQKCDQSMNAWMIQQASPIQIVLHIQIALSLRIIFIVHGFTPYK